MKYVEKVAICYNKSTKTIVKGNHLVVVNTTVELYYLEPKAKGDKYKRKKLFND